MFTCLVLTEAGFKKKAPDRFLLLPRGGIRVKDAPSILMDDLAAESVRRAFRDQGHDMVIDYEHQTMMDVEAPAAGWITGMTWEEDGLWVDVRWTDKARGYIESEEYRYYSPVLKTNKETRRVVRLHNLALTNQPRMNDVQALVAKHNLNEEGGKPMLKLLKLLGLASDASEDTAEAKLKEVLEQTAAKEKELKALKDKQGEPGGGEDVAACKEVMDALGLPADAGKDKVVASVTALKEPAKASGDLARKVAELESRVAGMAATSLAEVALKEGKTSKAELDAWGSKMATEQPELFKTVVLSREPGSVVPLGKVEVLKEQPKTPGAADDIQLSVNKQLGISDETYKKFGPQAGGGEA